MYQPPSPSRRSGASPAVVVTLCEKQNKIAASKGGKVLLSASQTTVETGETRKSSQEIIDKSAILGGGRSKRQWLKSPGLYKVSTAFSMTCFKRIASNIVSIAHDSVAWREVELVALQSLVLVILASFCPRSSNFLTKTGIPVCPSGRAGRVTFASLSIYSIEASTFGEFARPYCYNGLSQKGYRQLIRT